MLTSENIKHQLTARNVNAFALTFAFASSHEANASKVKRECKPTHLIVQTFVQTLTEIALNVNCFGQPVCETQTTHIRTDSRAAGNKVLPKAGVTGFYDTFVLNRTLVFQINSSAEMPRLRQYPKRYLQLIYIFQTD